MAHKRSLSKLPTTDAPLRRFSTAVCMTSYRIHARYGILEALSNLVLTLCRFKAGDQALIKDASLQSAGENGKWIHNVHIKPYQTEAEFWEHYEQTYTTIFSKAEEFIRSTSPTEDDNVLVFIR